jgi:hypothetical protein
MKRNGLLSFLMLAGMVWGWLIIPSAAYPISYVNLLGEPVPPPYTGDSAVDQRVIQSQAAQEQQGIEKFFTNVSQRLSSPQWQRRIHMLIIRNPYYNNARDDLIRRGLAPDQLERLILEQVYKNIWAQLDAEKRKDYQAHQQRYTKIGYGSAPVAPVQVKGPATPPAPKTSSGGEVKEQSGVKYGGGSDIELLKPKPK